RRAVAALRTAAFGHGALRFAQLTVRGQRLDGVNLPPGGHREKHQTAVDDMKGACALLRLNEGDRTCAAFAFCAAFLGTSEPLRTNEIEERHVRLGIVDADVPAVQKEIYRHAP